MISYIKSLCLFFRVFGFSRFVSRWLSLLAIVVLPFQVQGALKEDWFNSLSVDAPVCLKGKVYARFSTFRGGTPLLSKSALFEKNFYTGIVERYSGEQGAPSSYVFSIRNAEDLDKNRDEMNKDSLYKWMMVALESIVGQKTPGRGNSINSKRMVLSIKEKNAGLELAGRLSIPFNDKDYELPFIGKSVSSISGNSDSHGLDDQERTEVFKPTKKNRKQQKADANAVARIVSVELDDVGSQYCDERELKEFANDQLVGENKGKRYSCGIDVCYCGVTVCDELDVKLYSGRCFDSVSWINKKLQDPDSIDYRECIEAP